MSLPPVSIIVPARNEKNYIELLVQRLPFLSSGSEIIFVEGHSVDGTLDEIKRVAGKYLDKVMIRYTTQDGIGKADAVWKGFALAKNEILAILDADMTVMPEDLPRFLAAAMTGSNCFVNGTRLVYAMEKGAMRPLNYLGNKAFAWLLSMVCRQRLTDTLCGTKVIRKEHFAKIKTAGALEKVHDPFADFTLLLAASGLGLKIVEVPVYYRRRIYDQTKIRRFRDGVKLLKIVWQAVRHRWHKKIHVHEFISET